MFHFILGYWKPLAVIGGATLALIPVLLLFALVQARPGILVVVLAFGLIYVVLRWAHGWKDWNKDDNRWV